MRAHAVLNDGVAVGDECSIGAEAVLDPGVKVYPFKTIEAGAAIHTNLIWESRGITTIFGRDGVSGLVNVDITAEVAARLGAAYGTMLAKGARVVASRDAHPGVADDQAGDHLGPRARPASTSRTCACRCPRSTATR